MTVVVWKVAVGVAVAVMEEATVVVADARVEGVGVAAVAVSEACRKAQRVETAGKGVAAREVVARVAVARVAVVKVTVELAMVVAVMAAVM